MAQISASRWDHWFYKKQQVVFQLLWWETHIVSNLMRLPMMVPITGGHTAVFIKGSLFQLPFRKTVSCQATLISTPTQPFQLRVKLSGTLWGSWAGKPFCPPFLVGLQPPRPSLGSKGQIPTVANLGREGMQGWGRGSQETVVQPWGRVLVPPQGIHTAMSLSSLRCQHFSHQRKTTWDYIKGTRETHPEDYLRPDQRSAGPAHTLISSATPPLNCCYKTPHQILLGWDIQFFRAGARCVPFCLAKQ